MRKTIFWIIILSLSFIFTACEKEKEVVYLSDFNITDKWKQIYGYTLYTWGISKGVFYDDKRIEDFDPDTFKALNPFYIRSSDAVYVYGEKLKDVDINTFSVLYSSYAVDKNNVYNGSEIIKWADPDRFKLMLPKNTKITFDNETGVPNFRDVFYAKDWSWVYIGVKKIKEADLETFEVLNYDYAKDKNHVYRYEKIIEEADPSTFEFLNGSYSKDENNVYEERSTYFPGWKIKWADPSTFQVLEISTYAKDKNFVYWLGNVIEEADPLTFTVIIWSLYFWKDKNHVYHLSRVIKGASPETFDYREYNKMRL